MSKLVAVLVVALVPAAFLVATSGAAVRAVSGDSCKATGTGTSYSLSITVPSTAPAQTGFAIGASGTKVTNIVSGTAGTLSTSSLPANTSAAWMLSSPAAAGTLTASLTTQKPATGHFTVVAANSASGGYFSPMSCTIAGGALAKASFALGSHFTYVAASSMWHAMATLPGAGTLTYDQAFAHANNGEHVTITRLVRNGGIQVMGAGKIIVKLRPTAAGLAMLRAKGSITLNLNVAFKLHGGSSSGKLLHLTLRK